MGVGCGLPAAVFLSDAAGCSLLPVTLTD